MPAIDKVLFARFCVVQGDFCGVNPHYLAAVGQLRSQINDDTVDGKVGPFRFTQDEWNKNRKNPEYEPDFEPGDINIVVTGGETQAAWKMIGGWYVASVSIDKWR